MNGAMRFAYCALLLRLKSPSAAPFCPTEVWYLLLGARETLE